MKKQTSLEELSQACDELSSIFGEIMKLGWVYNNKFDFSFKITKLFMKFGEEKPYLKH